MSERDKFELWAEKLFSRPFVRCGDSYIRDDIESAWEAWKEASSDSLREAVRLHGFDSGEFGDVVSCEDLLNMANDLENQK